MADECKWAWLVEGFKYDLETETKPNTVAYYLHHVTAFVRWAKNGGNVSDPEQLSKRHIQGFFHDLLAEPLVATTGNGAKRQVVRTDRTRWHYYRSLKRFLGWAQREGFLKENPLDQIRLRQPVARPIEPYRPEHLRRMLGILDGAWEVAATPRQRMLAARTKAIVLLFLESGLRLAELAGLTVQDVDMVSQRVTVRHGKMGKGRYAGFGLDTKKALWKYLGLRDAMFPETRALWLGEEGQPLSCRGIQSLITRLKHEAGLEHVEGAVHKLRHTFATAYLRHTRDMKGCRLLLGHSSLAMVERYTQVIDAEDALAAYKVDGPLAWTLGNVHKQTRAEMGK